MQSARRIPRLLVSAMLFAICTTRPARAADVFVGVPPFNPDPGQQFTIDISVDVGSRVLGSYFFELHYNPAVVTVVSIGGGLTPQFNVAPTTNPASFSTGVTPIAAAQGNMASPKSFVSVASITFEAVGAPAQGSNLDLDAVSLFSGDGTALSANVFPSSVLINFDVSGDPDGDGLTNQRELAAGTSFTNPDTDGDGLSDGFEVLNGLDPLDNGSGNPSQGAAGDPDGDGFTNLQEAAVGSSPRNSRSRPVNTNLQLSQGFLPFFYPLELPAGFSAFDLLQQLNAGGNAVAAIRTVQNGTGPFRTATFNGAPAGDDFPLSPGQGVLAELRAGATANFAGPVVCPTINLVAGLNIVGLRCLPPGYTAFQMLTDIGSEADVALIQRFDSQTGRFESAAYFNGVPAGVNFPIRAAEAYLVHMHVDRPNFDPLQ